MIELPALKNQEGTYLLSLRFGYCRDGVGGLCKQHTAQWKIPIQIAADGKMKQISLALDLSKD